jgi:hypothetical protein
MEALLFGFAMTTEVSLRLLVVTNKNLLFLTLRSCTRRGTQPK